MTDQTQNANLALAVEQAHDILDASGESANDLLEILGGTITHVIQHVSAGDTRESLGTAGAIVFKLNDLLAFLLNDLETKAEALVTATDPELAAAIKAKRDGTKDDGIGTPQGNA